MSGATLSSLVLNFATSSADPPPASRLVFNGGARRETVNGREVLVAPITILRPGVLHGSLGPLHYPAAEVAAKPGLWNGTPLTLGHPLAGGRPVSAADPSFDPALKLGWLRNDRWDAAAKKRRAEGVFDLARLRAAAPGLERKLLDGVPVEVSTGLLTDNEPAPPGSEHAGRPYRAVARAYRPDHLAVLLDRPGACSIGDGCGIHNADGRTPPVAVCHEARAYGYCPRCGAPGVARRNGEDRCAQGHTYPSGNALARQPRSTRMATNFLARAVVNAMTAGAPEVLANIFCPSGPGGGVDPSCKSSDEGGGGGSGKEAVPVQPKGFRDWAALARTRGEDEWRTMADKVIAHVNDPSFTEQVNWQAESYQIPGNLKALTSRPQAVRAMAALEQYAHEYASEKSKEDQVAGKDRGASAGHMVSKDDRKAGWHAAWKIATEKIQNGTPVMNALGRLVVNAMTPGDTADVSVEKSCEIVADGTVHGRPLSDAQKAMFGAICGKKDRATKNAGMMMAGEDCPACGAAAPEGANYCPNCGREMAGAGGAMAGNVKKKEPCANCRGDTLCGPCAAKAAATANDTGGMQGAGMMADDPAEEMQECTCTPEQKAAGECQCHTAPDDEAGEGMMAGNATKTDAGEKLTFADYAFGDPALPSTWKLRLDDAAHVGAAVAALGPAGYRGEKVDIPAAALKAVKAKVRAAWKKFHPEAGDADVPEVLRNEAPRGRRAALARLVQAAFA